MCSSLPLLPPLPEAQAKATATSPDLQAAQASLRAGRIRASTSRAMRYLPSLGLDFFYGIDANQFAARTDHPTDESGRSTLPHYQVPYRQNLGYSAQATLNIPVWNWGATRSKIKQAELKQQQAQLDLTLAQRTLQGNLAAAYSEAQAAQAQLDSLRSSSDLSAESLRLTLLRYQAGEANALEVVDAQTTLAQARNAYDDGLVRYRVALATCRRLRETLSHVHPKKTVGSVSADRLSPLLLAGCGKAKERSGRGRSRPRRCRWTMSRAARSI